MLQFFLLIYKMDKLSYFSKASLKNSIIFHLIFLTKSGTKVAIVIKPVCPGVFKGCETVVNLNGSLNLFGGFSS